jgi:hypothetical protein
MPASLAPTPERMRRSAFVVSSAVATEAGPARAGSRVHRAISSLERLARTGAITPRQALAGERFRDDYELGVMGAREPAAGSTSTPGWSYTEAQIAAIRRWRIAHNKLGLLSVYVSQVAFADASIAYLARYFHQNRQEVAGVVKIGLDVLADCYHIQEC